MKKTAEDIVFERELQHSDNGGTYCISCKEAITAIEEYKDQHTAPLIEALEKAKHTIEFMHLLMGKGTNTGKSCIETIETALLNAKGL